MVLGLNLTMLVIWLARFPKNNSSNQILYKLYDKWLLVDDDDAHRRNWWLTRWREVIYLKLNYPWMLSYLASPVKTNGIAHLIGLWGWGRDKPIVWWESVYITRPPPPPPRNPNQPRSGRHLVLTLSFPIINSLPKKTHSSLHWLSLCMSSSDVNWCHPGAWISKQWNENFHSLSTPPFSPSTLNFWKVIWWEGG